VTGALKDRLREELLEQARTELPVTYKELADRLELPPPHTIHRITEALEQLMEEDVAAGRPLLAAFAVSKAQPGIPARGFFLKAQALGVFSGHPAGQEAVDFHAREVRRALRFYGRQAVRAPSRS
jgi:DNA mismatch repair protein MutH